LLLILTLELSVTKINSSLSKSLKNGISVSIKKFPFKIFMNHVLDYNGYRFFQSSYDQDEKGTILSVNNDPGKWPTYLGYLLLGIGMFWNILDPHRIS